MAEQRSIWQRLYYGETTFDFVNRSGRWFMLSAFVIALGVAGLLARGGLNLGIDFEGGTAWEVNAPGVSVTEAREELDPLGLGQAKIQIVGGDKLVVQAETGGDAERRTEITQALAELADTTPSEVVVNEVGPSWGQEISEKALRALVFFLIAITLYITLRFEWKMAVATILAMLHDIVVTVGVYGLSGFQVSPATVIAFLTILGFSLYDTVVVFDKIEENTRGLATAGRMTYADTVNLSMNQVLMRSLNTGLVAILPIISLLVVGSWILGATTLEDFALALLIGLITGAYSSIYIASPILVRLKEREPRYASIRQRLEARGGATGAPLTPAAAAANHGGGGAGESESPPTATPSRPAPSAPRPGNRPPPRPRKKKRR